MDLPALLGGVVFEPGGFDITLFKSVGTAIADFATVEHLLTR